MRDIALRLALPVPIHQLYDYLPPADVSVGVLCPGQRLLVPFGTGSRVGILVNLLKSEPERKLKTAVRLIDSQPLFPPGHLAMLTWLADYYHHPLGEVLMAALPVGLRGKAPLPDLRAKGWRLKDGERAQGRQLLSRAPVQAKLIESLERAGGVLTHASLTALGATAAALAGLVNKGLIEPCMLTSEVAVPAQLEAHLALSAEQKLAVDRVLASQGQFQCFVLNGVTGSGKTEVYLQLADQVLAQGRTVLMLVPEIGLTPQLLARVQARLCYRMAVLHSGLGDTERLKNWQMARLGEARILLGTRSAVLAPMPDLGLILVDEEHDSSYKQQEGFRYSARDTALVRAQRAGCPVVLGSATPSLESLANVAEGRYRQVELSQRAGNACPPTLKLLDVRDQKLVGGLSPRLLTEIRNCIERGQQAMLFLNRRGYSPVLACYQCGWLSGCPRCDARQTYHARINALICHHCGYQSAKPALCPDCGSRDIHPLGQGTERVEERLSQVFADVPLIRIDRDSTSRKGSLESKLDLIHQGGAAILVGTQMLAKGHHFPMVTLVGMLDMDSGFFGVDFRAQERMAQLILQVAGRAGRGDRPGEVYIQTRYPDHPLLQTLLNQGYQGFARQSLAERKLASLPPFSYQALLRARSAKPEKSEQFLRKIAEMVTGDQVACWGPVPAPMHKKAGRYYSHLLLQSQSRPELQAVLSSLVASIQQMKGISAVRWSLDVDPIDLY